MIWIGGSLLFWPAVLQLLYIYSAANSTCGVTNCTKTEIPVGQEIPSTWDWLKESHFMIYTEGNNTYDSWKLYTSFRSLQLVVKDTEAKKPYLLIKVDNIGEKEKMEFIEYEGGTPPDTAFGIPAKCFDSPKELH